MFKESNYKKYTLFELHQALGTINKDKYPNRVKLIEEQIKLRTDNPSLQDISDLKEIEKESVNWSGSFKPGLIYLTLGVVGLLSGTIYNRNTEIASYEDRPAVYLITIVVFFTMGIYKLIIAWEKWIKRKNSDK